MTQSYVTIRVHPLAIGDELLHVARLVGQPQPGGYRTRRSRLG